METTEMKQKNEEILTKWRGLGFLYGLKEGSINEWRCAKSFDNMANYLTVNSEEYDNSFGLSVIVFPFIRQALCSGKRRLYRLVRPEEVLDFLNTTTTKDVYRFLVEHNKIGSFSKIRTVKDARRILFSNIVTTSTEESLTYFFNDFYDETNDEYKLLKAWTANGLLDYEAEMLTLAVNMFVEKVGK